MGADARFAASAIVVTKRTLWEKIFDLVIQKVVVVLV